MTQKKKNQAPKTGASPMNYLALALEYKDANPQGYVRFLKSKAGVFFRDSAFWQSPLPSLHLEAILDSDLQATFFTEFFGKQENVNLSLLQLIAQQNLPLFQKYFKILYTHRIPAFGQALNEIASKVASVQSFAKEIDFVTNQEKMLIAERDLRDDFFLMLPPDKLIFGFLIWHQRLKVSESVKGNWARMVSLEVNMLDEIERILQKGCRAGKYVGGAPMFTDQAVVDRMWLKCAARRPYEEPQLSPIPMPKTLKMQLDVIELAHRAWYDFALLERYLAGHIDLSITDGRFVTPTENESNRLYRYDDRKSSYEEKYFINRSREFADLAESVARYKKREMRDWTKGSMMKMGFYGEPTTLTLSGHEVNLQKVLQILQLFSEHKGPIRENSFDPNLPSPTPNIGPKQFVEFLGPNEHLSVFDCEKFPAMIAKAMEWTIEEATTIVDLLTWDLASTSPPRHFIRRPFLLYAGKIYWMGTVLQGRNWAFAMQMRMRSNEVAPQFQNLLSSKFEEQIMRSFLRAGFVAKNGLKFTTENGKSGDIDVAAYKANHIFIVEAKNTLIEQGFVDTTYVETVRFQAKAAFQLDKCVEYATESKGELLAELGISPTEYSDLDAIRVYPMIVARHFEGDQVYYRDYPKLSFVELEVILTNGLDDLYGKGFHDHRRFHLWHDHNNPNFLNRPINFNVKRDLWEGQSSLTPETLIKCIEEGRVWQEFQDSWVF